ncbi:hypothetical protein MUP79_00755, partial [Candidatus Bathyarchaeota archaeon]|nr:hypothetical protein [Candidatus Bathyarchaeota archaeon]
LLLSWCARHRWSMLWSTSFLLLFVQFLNEIFTQWTEDIKHHKWFFPDADVTMLHVGWNTVEVAPSHGSFLTAYSQNGLSIVDHSDLFMWMRM